MFRSTLLTAAALLMAVSAQATTVNFTNWTYNSSNQVDWQVSVDDTTDAGFFYFSVDIGDPGLTGDIVGFGFDTNIDYGASILDDIKSYAADPVFGTCDAFCNWNGTGITPDYSFSVGSNGATDTITSFHFGLPTFGQSLSTSTFSLVAIRAQTVGPNEDSVKDYATVAGVPELNGSWAVLIFALVAALLALTSNRSRRPEVALA
ncbi:hypothetical protein [Halioxenophilus sp. WMMB6]|uniref:hypothetical protein n=1 Tax=Halioxenophilus sp. WMMB6 TaxID=3073815 RepID=UPI00295EFA22|nr:hypothetical protein [Halioxenophilus sp. WMMB6]